MLDKFRQQHLVWDFANEQVYEAIISSSGDSNGRTLAVTVYDAGTVSDLTGTELYLAWQRKDADFAGEDQFAAKDISKGEYELTYSAEMISHAGHTLDASLRIKIGESTIIESRPFEIIVMRSVYNEAAEESGEFSSLQAALVRLATIEADEGTRQANEQDRIDLYELVEQKLGDGDFDGADGVGLQYDWSGTQLGIKREDESTYDYTDLEGAKGDTGDTWKPAVSVDGDLSWIKDSGSNTPAQRNIKGPQGDKGDTGDTWKPSVSEGGDITWTKDSGSNTPAQRNITGPKGDTGDVWKPSVTSEGDLSWTKDSGATAPTTRNIKGDTGDTWKPSVSESGYLTWAKDSSGTTPTARDIKGPKGDTGDIANLTAAHIASALGFTPIEYTAGSNVSIDPVTGAISATDTITTINGKTGAIAKADITALGIPGQDTTYGDASTSAKGIVKLSTATDSTSTTLAATPSAVKAAYDRADAAFTSASNGKTAIGAAITGVDPSVVIPTDPTFAQLATAIGQISSGKKWASGRTNNPIYGTTNITGLTFPPSMVIADTKLPSNSRHFLHVRWGEESSGTSSTSYQDFNASQVYISSLTADGFDFFNWLGSIQYFDWIAFE